MEIKIGVQNAPRELTIDTDLDVAAIEKQVEAAVSGSGVLAFSDAKGRRVLIPADRIAYVEIATSTAGTVGFRS
ncbi:MAG: hypothetical protein JWO46_2044 [Nocardioidaceae bacterium]|jgi:hypothetical protein|nr:hypothetical protein [Nocardioidaceae bacterium]